MYKSSCLIEIRIFDPCGSNNGWFLFVWWNNWPAHAECGESQRPRIRYMYGIYQQKKNILKKITTTTRFPN